MCYDDVFLVWESIWSAKYVCCDSYVAFIALAMVEAYRDILLDNSMDFIDVMKFFNGKNLSLQKSRTIEILCRFLFIVKCMLTAHAQVWSCKYL